MLTITQSSDTDYVGESVSSAKNSRVNFLTSLLFPEIEDTKNLMTVPCTLVDSKPRMRLFTHVQNSDMT